MKTLQQTAGNALAMQFKLYYLMPVSGRRGCLSEAARTKGRGFSRAGVPPSPGRISANLYSSPRSHREGRNIGERSGQQLFFRMALLTCGGTGLWQLFGLSPICHFHFFSFAFYFFVASHTFLMKCVLIILYTSLSICQVLRWLFRRL